MWELKIKVISYLIQIYFLAKYLVENADNSISGNDWKEEKKETQNNDVELQTRIEKYITPLASKLL